MRQYTRITITMEDSVFVAAASESAAASYDIVAARPANDKVRLNSSLGKPQTPNSKLQIPNSKLQTASNPKPQTPNSKPQTPNRHRRASCLHI